MTQTSLSLPYFDDAHRRVIPAFREWVSQELSPFEASEGGDGVDARKIFNKLGDTGWLRAALGTSAGARATRPDIRMVALMREALAHGSAVADVAFSEPWLAVLPCYCTEALISDPNTSPNTALARNSLPSRY